jgi:predicted amidohydrolase YtcJ
MPEIFNSMKTILLFLIGLLISIQMIAQKFQADLIVHNALVYTVDESFSTQQAFAIKEGKFIAVGKDSDILKEYVATETIDAKGQAIYPGLIDAHCHFYSYGLSRVAQADLVGTGSFKEVVEKLQDFAKENPSDFILGRGWDQNDWEIKEFPDNNLLDNAFPDVPVFVRRIDGHAGIANSKALEMAGITINSKVNGGEVKMKKGELTGVLVDNAMELMSGIIPLPNESVRRNALEVAQSDCFAVGLTSVVDAGLGNNIVKLIDEMQKAGEIKMRVNAMLSPTQRNLNQYVKNGPWQTDRLTVRSIKLYADGALGSRGAKLIRPYSDAPETNGLLIETLDYYREICKLAYENGYQINTHAIGDSANRMMLNIYGEFLKGENDLRWRIEHAQVVNEEDFHLFGKYSIIPSVQSTHCTSDMYWAEDRLGPERIKGAYAYKTLLKENGWLPLGTDFPIESINPLFTFYAAVARKDLKGFPENGFQTKDALSREEALRGITIWAAKGSFEENIKGSIEPGKVADFVILGKDIMKIEIDEVPDVKVISTWSGGEKVYIGE